ncbi:MAG: tRNA pseudouridine(55) synthase TruB [Proteobacteria bacterium]|nr:tRNA pseudouridine(55) synthase TruB [Pseudomonadota bacterium]
MMTSPNFMNGLLLVDKPSGPTSFDVVRTVRRAAGLRKVGHTGTLDPLASGLIVVCLGQGTKLVPFLMDTDKRYLARVKLGTGTDTDDALGDVVEEAAVPVLERASLERKLGEFVGRLQQVPPKFSAIKKDGEPLYRKARRGEEVTPEAREVEIICLALTGVTADQLDLDVRCGKGTYIRSLARDIAKSLGTCGHLESLRRVETAGFSVEHALALDNVEAVAKEGRLSECLIPLAEAIPAMPKVQLGAEEEKNIRNGQAVPCVQTSGTDPVAQRGYVRLLGVDNRLCAMATVSDGHLRPKKVFT